MAGINYSYENPEETRNASGNVAFRQSRTNSSTSTFRTNFLSDGDTYDYSYSDGYRRETDLDTRHQIYFRNEKIGFGAFAMQGSISIIRNRRPIFPARLIPSIRR